MGTEPIPKPPLTDAALQVSHPKSVDVALAEFNALRGEIIHHATTQAALVGVGLTALGVIFGLVVREGGDQRLLYAVPPVATLVSLLYARGTYRVASIGDYIRNSLWPYLQGEVGEVPSWEDEVATRRRRWWTIPLAFLMDGPATALFVVASGISLVLVGGAEPGLRNAGWVLTGVAILVPIVIGLIIRHNSRLKEQARPVAAQSP